MANSSRKRPCRYCRRWFSTSPRLGKRQYACSSVECQAKRKAENQRAWKSANRRRARAARARGRRDTSCAKVSPASRGDSISPQVSPQQGLTDRLSPHGVGDSILVQGRILTGLVARLARDGGGDSIGVALSELHDHGCRLLGGSHGKTARS